MRNTFQALLLATGLCIPSFVIQPHAIHASEPGTSSMPGSLTPLAITNADPITISSSAGSPGATAAIGANNINHVALLNRPDLETRILDQSGPHDPTIYPPSASQEMLALQETEVLTVQVRNASGPKADNVEVELYLTGLLDPDLLISATNGFTCSMNAPAAHFVLCTGGTLSAGGWNSAASIMLGVKAVNTGSSFIVTTVNPDHSIAESDSTNDQDVRGISVVETKLH